MKKVTRANPNQRLVNERLQRHWSQQELANRAGTTAINVSRWERGITTPGPYFQQQLCTLFEKSADELGFAPAPPDTAPVISEPVSSTLYDPTIPLPLPEKQHLVGRDTLLAHVRQRLCAGNTAALTALNGLPGVGKTALAVALAHDRQMQEHFRDGILWVGLGPHPNLFAHLGRWGRLLGLANNEIEAMSSLEARTISLRSLIDRRHMLLIIDDAWQIEDALAFQVGGLHCAYLLTTRFPEIAHQFAGEGAALVQELSEDDSLVLLRQFIPQVVENRLEEVRALVKAVGGLPLATTLIGKYLYLQVQSNQPRRLEMALTRLHNAEERLHLAAPLPLLERSPNLPPGMPHSLQATIAISEQQLDAKLRSALLALSLFPPKPNTFSEEAAIVVGALNVEMLDQLINSGLLEGSSPGRYTLHQTIADYLRLYPVEEAVAERFASFFASFVETHSSNYESLDPEIQNILAALSAAHTLASPTAFLSAITRCADFLETKRLFSFAETHLTSALTLTRSLEQDGSEATILLHLGRLAELRGDYVRAEQFYEEGLPVAHRFDVRQTICALLAHLGEVAIIRGYYARAEDHLHQGLLLARTLDDQQKMLLLLKNLGETAESRGAYTQADEWYRQALMLARQLQNWEIICALLQNMGAKALREGHEPLAEQYLQEGLAHARRISHQQRITGILLNLGNLALQRQQYVQAEEYYQETLHLARRIEHRLREGSVLQNLGELECLRGNDLQAVAYLQESLEIAQQIGHPWLTCETRCVLADLHLKQGEIETAHMLYQETLEKAQTMGAQELIATALFGLARVAHTRADPCIARQLAQASLTIFQEMGHGNAATIATWISTLPQTQERQGHTVLD